MRVSGSGAGAQSSADLQLAASAPHKGSSAPPPPRPPMSSSRISSWGRGGGAGEAMGRGWRSQIGGGRAAGRQGSTCAPSGAAGPGGGRVRTGPRPFCHRAPTTTTPFPALHPLPPRQLTSSCFSRSTRAISLPSCCFTCRTSSSTPRLTLLARRSALTGGAGQPGKASGRSGSRPRRPQPGAAPGNQALWLCWAGRSARPPPPPHRWRGRLRAPARTPPGPAGWWRWPGPPPARAARRGRQSQTGTTCGGGGAGPTPPRGPGGGGGGGGGRHAGLGGVSAPRRSCLSHLLQATQQDHGRLLASMAPNPPCLPCRPALPPPPLAPAC
jgi:translation initiation factor IF-2